MAMFEYNWASFEPTQGVLSSSYLATMKYELASYQAAGQKVTLGLGLQNPPSWVFSLANSRYIDQNGSTSSEANFVFSQAVRSAAAQYLSLVAAAIPLSNFYAVRLTSGGDGEMLYPGGGTYWAFDNAALTGSGLASGMTRNPDPSWKPGTAGLSQAQISTWVSWYIGGLDNVTNWQIQTLSGLGFTGYYQTVTPGSGSRPDYLAQEEQNNLNDQSTTGVGAVWNLYYAQLPNKANVIAYISSVADQSGGNDSCQSSDASLSLTNTTMDSWSATRWISRIAVANNLPVGGENPGYGLPGQPGLLLHQHLIHRHDGQRHPHGPLLQLQGLLLGPRHPPVGRHPPLLPLRRLHRPRRHPLRHRHPLRLRYRHPLRLRLRYRYRPGH